MTDSKKQTTQTEKQIAQAEERAAETEKRLKSENIMRNLSKTKQKNLLLMALLSKFLLNRRRRR